jgi:hypothetical protein
MKFMLVVSREVMWGFFTTSVFFMLFLNLTGFKVR